jgi:N-acetyl sugar amidotransferase
MAHRITYCTRCLIPDTKPHALFDEEGVCSACRAHERRHDALDGVDWAAREREFDALVEAAKARNAPFYDVVVPVSGGKDSITQVHRLLGRDLRILAVNVDHAIKTEIGEWNLSRIPAMGASLVTYRPDEQLHTRLIRIGLEEYGDPDLLSHCLLHAFPLHAALRFGAPLVALGENSAAEYGGDAAIALQTRMTRDWFERFAAHSGATPRAFGERHGIPYERLRPYDFPDEIEESGTTATFLSHFFRWDSEDHLAIARGHGFRTLDGPSEGTYRNYVGIDERMNRVHQYLKVLKFGYGRATDHACEDIRNDRLSREDAKELVRRHDLLPLSDAAVGGLLEWLGYSRAELDEQLERFRNHAIWARASDGSWMIPHHLEDEVPTT